MLNHNDDQSDFIIDPKLEVRNPELSEFLSYYTKQRGDRKFPGRSDIQPRDIVPLLPWIHMYNVENSDTFNIRLIGTEIAALLPPNSAPGSALALLPSPLYRRLQRGLETVLQLRAPIRSVSERSVLTARDFTGVESVFAPLSSNETDIDIIIAMTIFSKG